MAKKFKKIKQENKKKRERNNEWMNERNEYRNIVVNGLLNIQIAINGGLTISIVSVRHKIRYKKRIEWRRVCVCVL